MFAFGAFYLIPTLLLAAFVNPAFSHEGVTILTYLPSGNPLTLESICYGIAAAVMLVTVILWFSCYNAVMTSDKFIYLFGKIIPGLSLILSMVLRFVPKFKAQLAKISEAQACIGQDVHSGGIIRRIKNGVKIISIMISWALEDAIETADSMRTRGYGLPGRTAFSIYKFDSRDKKAMAFIAGLIFIVIMGSFLKLNKFRYYPSMKGAGANPLSIFVFLCYFALCITPLCIELWEDRKWKQLESKA